MSTALVRKSLEIVDEELAFQKSKKRKPREIRVPKNYTLTREINHGKNKVSKVNILQHQKKITVAEARRTKKTEEEILQENLRKIKAIQQSCCLNLDKNILKKIIKRGVTKRPVIYKKKKSKDKKTAFTEEDFAKFEAEYTGD